MFKLPKLKSLNDDTSGILALVMLAVGLLIILVVWQILPLVNSNIAASITIPADGHAGSEWNSTVNTELVNSSELFQSTGGIFKVVVIVAMIAVLLAYLFSVIPRQGSPGTGGI